MAWSLALCPDDAKQDPMVYSAKFGVVFLAKGQRSVSIRYRSSMPQPLSFGPGGRGPLLASCRPHAGNT